MRGVLNIDKPAQWTSHDVVAKVRHITGIRQVGHAGTLDPMATGVLVLGLGRATRLLEYLVGQPKTYLAGIRLGVATDTYDATGKPVSQSDIPALSREDLEAVLQAFRGDIMQRPPPYSAIKRDGQRLYRLARQGETVEVEPRPVTVYDFDLLAYDGKVLQAQITCSAGTYIRSLAHDLGQALGCGAHLSSLRRLAVGSFRIEDAVTLDRLDQATEAGTWTQFLLPPDAAVAHLGQITLTHGEAAQLSNGQAIAAQGSGSAAPMRAYDPAGHLLAIVIYDPGCSTWQPAKVFA